MADEKKSGDSVNEKKSNISKEKSTHSKASNASNATQQKKEEKKEEKDQRKNKDEKEEEKEEYPRPPCNPRLDELAKPAHRIYYYNYRYFRCVLPKEKIEAIGQTLQEDMAMSTEDAAEKLKEMRKKEREQRKHHIEQMKARKEIRELSKRKQKALMRRCVKETLKTAIYNAYFNPKQIIMSDRLRKLSNLIVRDICKLMKMSVPDRKDNGKDFMRRELFKDIIRRRAQFLFAVGDYFAYGIETMYFEIQVRKMATYEEIKEKEREEEEKEGKTATPA